MTKPAFLHDQTDNQAFRQAFSHCRFENAENRMGPAEVLALFGRPWQEACEFYSPVLISWNPDRSDYGSSLYVLMHDTQHRFFEVHGSTSSMWAFEGSWSPEPVSPEEMRGILTIGWLRADPSNPLRELREAAATAMGLDLEAIDRRAHEAQKLLEREGQNVPPSGTGRRPGRRR